MIFFSSITAFSQRTITYVVFGFEKTCNNNSNHAIYFVTNTCINCPSEQFDKMEKELIDTVKSKLGDKYSNYYKHEAFSDEAWAVVEAEVDFLGYGCKYNTLRFFTGSDEQKAIENAQKGLTGQDKYLRLVRSAPPIK